MYRTYGSRVTQEQLPRSSEAVCRGTTLTANFFYDPILLCVLVVLIILFANFKGFYFFDVMIKQIVIFLVAIIVVLQTL